MFLFGRLGESNCGFFPLLLYTMSSTSLSSAVHEHRLFLFSLKFFDFEVFRPLNLSTHRSDRCVSNN